MAHRKLNLVKEDLSKSLNKSEKLAIVASIWNRAGKINGVPRFSTDHLDMIVGLAFLSGFLAWERFLEESFILYLLGKSAQNGYKPFCYVIPKNRQHANEFCKGDRKFADWNDVNFVTNRSNQFFLDGKPFTDSLRTVTNSLNNMKTIRNAIAHQSTESQERFENLVRRELGYYPHRTNPGNFLLRIIVGTIPPSSYLEGFFNILLSTAFKIVPS
jgi:hypothetical protein